MLHYDVCVGVWGGGGGIVGEGFYFCFLNVENVFTMLNT